MLKHVDDLKDGLAVNNKMIVYDKKVGIFVYCIKNATARRHVLFSSDVLFIMAIEKVFARYMLLQRRI